MEKIYLSTPEVWSFYKRQTSKLSVTKNKLYKGKFHKEVYSRTQFFHLKRSLKPTASCYSFLIRKDKDQIWRWKGSTSKILHVSDLKIKILWILLDYISNILHLSTLKMEIIY